MLLSTESVNARDDVITRRLLTDTTFIISLGVAVPAEDPMLRRVDVGMISGWYGQHLREQSALIPLLQRHCRGGPVSFIPGEPCFKSQRRLMLHRLYFGLLIMDAVSGGNNLPG